MKLININLEVDFFTLCEKIIIRKYRGNEISIIFAINEELGAGYNIDLKRDVSIRGGNKTGLIAGIGCYLRGGSGDHTPLCALNGSYFATHFNNFYMTAPLEEIYCFLEDLALWGQNAFSVWYDMHSYTSVDNISDVGESSSVKVIIRLRQLLSYARKLGMKLALMCIGNEGFKDTPDELRAEWTVQNGYFAPPMGHYHVEICPSRMGGIKKILDNRRVMLAAFADLEPDYLIVFPYDQGGCTCSNCAPWGINGFIRTINALSELIDDVMPNIKIILGTWGFNRFINGEWEGLYDVFEKMKPSVRDKIAFILNQQVGGEQLPGRLLHCEPPGNKPIVGFPEVSMYGSVPWGGFGTNVTPEVIQNDTEKIKCLFEKNIKGSNIPIYGGQFQYSEGFFADVNHSLVLAIFSGSYKTTADALYDYIKLEITDDPDVINDVRHLLYMTEHTLPRNRIEADGNILNYPPEMADIGIKIPEGVKFVIYNTKEIEETYKLAKSLDNKVRQSKRWRIILLRTAIDHELLINNFYISEKAQEYFNELTELYYAEKAYYVVYPPHK